MGLTQTVYEFEMVMDMKTGEVQSGLSMHEFIELFQTLGGRGTARKLGQDYRTVLRRRRNIERELNININAPNIRQTRNEKYPYIIHKEIDTGMCVIGSDFHYWPNEISTAHRAMVKFLKTYQPSIKLLIANGDVFDGARISRFPRIGWDSTPTIKQELEAAIERLGELEQAHPKVDRTWNLGNHCARFETRLASEVPEFEGIKGYALKDFFPHWSPCWETWINEEIVVRHRWKNGIHATHNNTVNSGVTMITGHLHSQKVTPFTDLRGDRWGVDCGTMAEIYGPQFSGYMEGHMPRNWRSGFAVLTFKKGTLLQPELVRVISDGEVEWRGETYAV